MAMWLLASGEHRWSCGWWRLANTDGHVVVSVWQTPMAMWLVASGEHPWPCGWWRLANTHGHVVGGVLRTPMVMWLVASFSWLDTLYSRMRLEQNKYNILVGVTMCGHHFTASLLSIQDVQHS